MGNSKFYRRRGGGGTIYVGRTRRNNKSIDEKVDVVDYLKKGAWTELGSMERPKRTDNLSEDEEDVQLVQYIRGKEGINMSDRRTGVNMKSKTSNVSRAVEWNGIVYNIPDMKGWKGKV